MEKRITLVYLGRRGGAVPYGFEMTKALLDNGVRMLCILSELICNKAEWERLEKDIDSLELVFLPTYSNKVEFIKNMFDRVPYCKAVETIRKFNPDAIYLPMISLNARRLVFKLKEFPLVTTIHDYTQHPGMKNPFSKFIFEQLERASNKFVVLTSKYAGLLSDKYSVPMSYISHIPHANFSYYNKCDNKPLYDIKNNILFFGRISKYKGISVLLRSFEILKYELPKLRLTIVGKGKLSDNDLDIIRSNPERIILDNSWISDDEVWNLFANSDITVVPYIEASQSGVVALSFSCGRTVIASDVGGLSEQVSPAGGIVIPPANPMILADEIIRLYQNPNRILNMNREAHIYASESLTWQYSAEKLLKLIYES